MSHADDWSPDGEWDDLWDSGSANPTTAIAENLLLVAKEIRVCRREITNAVRLASKATFALQNELSGGGESPQVGDSIDSIQQSLAELVELYRGKRIDEVVKEKEE